MPSCRRSKAWFSSSKAIVRDKSYQKIAFIGGKTPVSKDLALYLQDNAQALQIVGNTKIEGDAYVGSYGIKPGQMSGQSYTNSHLVYGKIYASQELPKLQLEKEQYLQTIENHYLDTNSNVEFFDLNLTKSLSQSFLKPTRYFFSSESIALFSKDLSGNIVIQSKQHIYIDASCQLKDVILIAPEITIGKAFKGQIQAFASQNLTLKSDVELEYPSALVVLPQLNFEYKLPQLHIGSNCKIKGSIAYLNGNDTSLEQQTFSHLRIEESTQIYGQIYSNYNLELKGDVFGHVLTNQFITSHKGSLYINHLLDVGINAFPVSNEFAGLWFNEKQVVSWVD